MSVAGVVVTTDELSSRMISDDSVGDSDDNETGQYEQRMSST
jgi:hypothetical protein